MNDEELSRTKKVRFVPSQDIGRQSFTLDGNVTSVMTCDRERSDRIKPLSGMSCDAKQRPLEETSAAENDEFLTIIPLVVNGHPNTSNYSDLISHSTLTTDDELIHFNRENSREDETDQKTLYPTAEEHIAAAEGDQVTVCENGDFYLSPIYNKKAMSIKSPLTGPLTDFPELATGYVCQSVLKGTTNRHSLVDLPWDFARTFPPFDERELSMESDELFGYGTSNINSKHNMRTANTAALDNEKKCQVATQDYIQVHQL